MISIEIFSIFIVAHCLMCTRLQAAELNVTTEAELPRQINNTIVRILYREDPYEIDSDVYLNNATLLIDAGVIIRVATLSGDFKDIVARNGSTLELNGNIANKVNLFCKTLMAENSFLKISHSTLSLELKLNQSKLAGENIQQSKNTWTFYASVSTISNIKLAHQSTFLIQYSDFNIEDSDRSERIELTFVTKFSKLNISSINNKDLILYVINKNQIKIDKSEYMRNFLVSYDQYYGIFYSYDYPTDKYDIPDSNSFIVVNQSKISLDRLNNADNKAKVYDIVIENSTISQSSILSKFRWCRISNSIIDYNYKLIFYMLNNTSQLEFTNNTGNSEIEVNFPQSNISNYQVDISRNTFNSKLTISCSLISNINMRELRRNRFNQGLGFVNCFNVSLRENYFPRKLDSCSITSEPFIAELATAPNNNSLGLRQIDAVENYWETTNFYEASLQICMNNGFTLYNEVKIAPLLNSSYQVVDINPNNTSFLVEPNLLNGFLKSDLILDARNTTTYYVNQSIIILPNVTFTIMAGTNIIFNKDSSSIFILGRILVVKSPYNNSTRASLGKFNGYWNGLYVESVFQSGINNLEVTGCYNIDIKLKNQNGSFYSTDHSSFEFDQVNFSASKISLLTSGMTSVILNNSDISTTQSFSISTDKSSLIILNSKFKNYQDTFSNACGINDTSCRVLISNSTLDSTGYYNYINIYSNKNLTLVSSVFIGKLFQLYRSNVNQELLTVDSQKNSFNMFSTSSNQLFTIQHAQSRLYFSENNFMSQGAVCNLYKYDQYRFDARFTITNNTFNGFSIRADNSREGYLRMDLIGNSFTNSEKVNFFQYGLIDGFFRNFNFINNRLYNLENVNYLIDLSISYMYQDPSYTQNLVEENDFENISQTTLISVNYKYYGSPIKPLNSSLIDLKVNRNRFINTNSYIFDTNIEKSQLPNFSINATYNYWQSKSFLLIKSKSIRPDTKLLSLSILPFYEDSQLRILNNESIEGMFDSVQIGGTLPQDLVRLNPLNPLLGRSYQIISSIIIPANYTLVIEAGVEINFTAEDRFSFICYGSLIVNGNSTHPVTINVNGNSLSDNEYNLIQFNAGSNEDSQSSLNYLVVNHESMSAGSTILLNHFKYPKLNNVSIRQTQQNATTQRLDKNQGLRISSCKENSPSEITSLRLSGLSTCLNLACSPINLKIFNSYFVDCIRNAIYVLSENVNITIDSTIFLSTNWSASFKDASDQFLDSNYGFLYLSLINSKMSTEWTSRPASLNVKSYEAILEKNSFENVIVMKSTSSYENKFQFLSNSFTFNLAFDEAKITKNYYTNICINWMFANNQFYLSKSHRLIDVTGYDYNSISCRSNSFLNIQNNSVYIQDNNTDQSQLLIFTNNLYNIDAKITNNSFYYPAGFLLSYKRNQFFEFSDCSNLSINYNIFHIDAYEFPKDPTGLLNCPFKSSSFMNPVKLLNARSNYFGAQTELWLQTCSVPNDENHFDYYPTIKENGVLDTLSRKLLDKGYFYGGFLTTNTFIDSSLSQNSSSCEFAVIGNILVPENVELTLDIGCTLRFRSKEGIFVNGVLKSMGTNESPVRLTGDNWRGVRIFYEKAKFISKFTVIEKTSANYALEYYKPNETTIRNVAINQCEYGIQIRSPGNWIMDNVRIENINYNALNYFPEYRNLDSENVQILNSSIYNTDRIYIYDYKLLSMFNSSFKRISGFYIYYINQLSIYDCEFDMIGYISVMSYSYDSCMKMSITNNRFTNSNIFDLDINNICENMGAMSFMNNLFSGSPQSQFNRITFSFGYQKTCENCTYIINSNYLNNMALKLNIADGIQVVLSDNTIDSVNMSAWAKSRRYYEFYSVVELNVQQPCVVLNNTFVNSSYVNGLMVTTNQPLKKISILNNQFVGNFESYFLDSFSDYATNKSYNILLNSVSLCRVGNNLFVRSLSIDYDVGFTGALVQRTINGTSNYWNGLNTSLAIKNRIDLNGNSEIFLFEPFLNNASLLGPDLGSEFNCSIQNWCNENGNCLADNYCRCFKGYKGDSCAQFDCPADCNKEKGNCTGPLTCTCQSGYFGSDCSKFSCKGNCQDRGQCIGPDKCRCEKGWSDTSLCLDCLPNFFGPNCLPLSLVYSAYPLKVESYVQGFIRLYGVNFINSDGWYRVYTCSYSNIDTSIAFSKTAQIVDDTQLLCELENGLFEKFFAGDDIDFRLVKNSQEVLFSAKLSIYYNCSTNACGEREPVKRGYCRYGSCVCLFPFDGPNCETRMYEPRFSLPSNWSSVIQVLEFSNFSMPVKLNETTTMPVEWQLTTAPRDMQLINNNSMLVWNRLTSSSSSNQVELKVSNKLGTGNLTFSVLIEPAYVVELADIAPKNVFVSAPLYILVNITLRVAQNASQGLRGALPVTLRLTKYLFNNMVTTNEYNDMNLITLINGRLTYVFYPNRKEYGEFILEAMHPFLKSNFNNVLPGFSSFNYTVLGIRLNQSDIRFRGYVNDTFERVVQLQNPNSIATLTNLSWNYATSEYVTIELFKFSSKPSETWTKVDNNSTLQARLDSHEQVLFKIKLTPKLEGIYSNDYLEFKSKEGVRTSLFVYTNIKTRKPEINCNTYSFNFRMINGTQKLLSFEVTNSGDLDSGSIAVNLVEPTKNAAQIRILETNLARFENGSLVLNNLGINETKTIYFSVDVDSNQDEGFYSAQITIRNQFVYNSVGITYFVSHSNDVQLAVLVQDEFTYYSPLSPLVANATVTIVNQATNYRRSIVSNSSGVALFTNLTENWYELQVQADRHSSVRLIWQPHTNMNYETVFLQRVTVVITWTVKPVFYQDKYEIELEQNFETKVYAPVIVVTPMKINVLEFETTDFILFNVTNYGLVAAYNFTLEIPASFQNYEFRLAEPSDFFLVELPANSSHIIRMNVFEKKEKSEATKNLLLKSSWTECFSYIPYTYSYFCGKFLSQGSAVFIDANCIIKPIDTPSEGGSGGGGGPSEGIWSECKGKCNYTPQEQGGNICDLCWKAVAKCLLLAAVDKVLDKVLDKIPSKNRRAIYKFILCMAMKSDGECELDVLDLIDHNESSKKEKVEVSYIQYVIQYVEAILALLDLFKCFLDESKNCPGAQNGAKAALLSEKALQIEYKEDIAARISYVMLAINNQYQIAIETYGDLIWIDKTPNMWLTENFFPCLSDLSEAGRLISSSESLVIGERATNDQFFESTGISRRQLDALIERFNNTQKLTEGINLIDSPSSNSSNIMNMTRLGELSRQHVVYKNVTASFGYASFYDWLDHLLEVYDNAPVRRNVCARIKLLISQTLMLTREGFEATLEIDNRESSQLTNISIQIQIFKSNDTSEIIYNKLFSIGTPMLTGGLSGVNGDGTLSGQQTGKAVWFLAPYREAANVTEQVYTVGGFLKYVLDGKLLSYELDPQSITVRPEPRLNLFYFLEKYVQGDDPLTPNVTEPIEPFSLALMLVNRGYGTAMSLSMLTMQPKIIENEKGLLISFKLEDDAYMNNAMIKNSMNVSFGDVKPFEFRHVVWKFSSSLKGTFSNLSVTYTNKNPNGDPKLSLIDDIEYRQLYRLVSVDWPNTLNDSLPDFLVVEDFGSGLEMPYPNQLFMSNSNLTFFSVQFFPELFKIQQSNSLYFLNSFIETQLEQKISNASNGWFYTYVIIDPYLIENDKITKITRIHDGLARPVKNFWTTYVDSETIKLSIFDYFSTFDNSKSRLDYFKNLSYKLETTKISSQEPPRFDRTTFEFNFTTNFSVSNNLSTTFVGQVKAISSYNNESLEYFLINGSSYFEIDRSNGRLSIKNSVISSLSNKSSLVVSALVNDLATSPILSANCNVKINIIATKKQNTLFSQILNALISWIFSLFRR